MTKQEIHNRGYNLMIAVLVLLPGLAFGSLNETDLNDKIDDGVPGFAAGVEQDGLGVAVLT